MRHRLLISARSILLGWAALFAITYLIERPLLVLAARLLDASWFPTAQLALACAGLAATGWIMGRWNRVDAMATALIFAVLLAVWNFGLVPIDISWLFRLVLDSLQSSRYLESLFTSLVTHAFLFASLFAGARLSRASQPEELHIFPSG
jgi:hypothetical protein